MTPVHGVDNQESRPAPLDEAGLFAEDVPVTALLLQRRKNLGLGDAVELLGRAAGRSHGHDIAALRRGARLSYRVPYGVAYADEGLELALVGPAHVTGGPGPDY